MLISDCLPVVHILILICYTTPSPDTYLVGGIERYLLTYSYLRHHHLLILISPCLLRVTGTDERRDQGGVILSPPTVV